MIFKAIVDIQSGRRIEVGEYLLLSAAVMARRNYLKAYSKKNILYTPTMAEAKSNLIKLRIENAA